MRKIILLGISILLLAIVFVIWQHLPKHLASSADYIPEFFCLPSDAVKGMTVIDKLHSQGKTVFSFGLNHYWLKFKNPKVAADAISKAGGSETDSVWSITRQRGMYIGTFTVSLKDNRGHLRYAEIEGD